MVLSIFVQWVLAYAGRMVLSGGAALLVWSMPAPVAGVKTTLPSVYYAVILAYQLSYEFAQNVMFVSIVRAPRPFCFTCVGVRVVGNVTVVSLFCVCVCVRERERERVCVCFWTHDRRGSLGLLTVRLFQQNQ